MNSGFVERNLGEVYGKNLLLYGQNANMRIEETELEWRGRESNIIVQDYAGDCLSVFEVKYSRKREYLEADCEKQSHSDNMKIGKTNREGREDCE